MVTSTFDWNASPGKRRLQWVALYVAFCLIVNIIDLTQMSADFYRRGSSPLLAFRHSGWASLEWLARGLVAPFAIWMCARYPGWHRAAIARHAAASLVGTMIVIALSAPFVFPQYRSRPPGETFTQLFTSTWLYIASRYLLPIMVLYAIVAAAANAVRYHNEYIRTQRLAAEHERNALILQSEIATAEMNALEAQVDPAMIFRTLDQVGAKVRDGEYRDVVRITTRLARRLRASIDSF